MQFGFVFCQFFGKFRMEKLMTKPPGGTVEQFFCKIAWQWLKIAGTSHEDLDDLVWNIIELGGICTYFV